MKRQHKYQLKITWTGNKGTGTSHYKEFERSHTIHSNNKIEILGSSDPAFGGDKTRYNPEDLLVASIASCHMLWYLHLCSVSGVIVTGYIDLPAGLMTETADGSGKFTEVTLYPMVSVTEISMIEKANQLHKKANELCFIANSVNFPVYHQPTCKLKGAD